MLIIALYGQSIGHSQIIRTGDFGLEHPVNYQARDSMVVDVPNQIIRIYGQANVKYADVNLDADYIEIDILKSEVSATYSVDSAGNPIGKPIFTFEGEEIKCDAMKYNFKTEKAYITEVRTTQGDGYIHMAESKRQPNEEMHFKNGKYTTCDKEKPHFHFQLSKAIIVPDKRIVTGPVHMRILNVPLPIAAPFAFLPTSEKKKLGFIVPRFALAGDYGTGFENLGYYFPINKQWETFVYGTAFTSGRWAISNRTNYNIKYKHSGTFEAGYERLKGQFFEVENSNNFKLIWNHNQHAKAHPSLKFGANINFRSNNDASDNIEIISENQFASTFNSAVNLNKSWKLGRFSGAWSTKVSLQQNSNSLNYSFELPSFNLSINRFDLGVLRKNKIGKKWYENINVTYNLYSKNSALVADSIVNESIKNGDYSFLDDYNKSGIQQKLVIQSNLKPKSGWYTFNLKTQYIENWNFQSIQKDWNPITDTLDVAYLNGFSSARNLSFSGGLNTNVYGYLKTKLKNELKFRHVLTPNVTFSYSPDLGNHQLIQIDTTGTFGYYSPFDLSQYRELASGESGRINFSLGNTIEMKRLDKNDTINNTFKSSRILDRFSISGNYDFLKDSLKLSNLVFGFQSTPIKLLSIQASAILNPYEWVDSTGLTTNNYAWNANKGIGRITTANLTLGSNFKNKAILKSDSLSKFKNIKWKLNALYNINYSRNTSGIVNQDTFKLTNTIQLKGNFDFWNIWSLQYSVLTDIMTLTTNPNPMLSFTLKRQLHCWETSLTFRKTDKFWGEFTSTKQPAYLVYFKINIKSSMFDAFLPEQRIKTPTDWY